MTQERQSLDARGLRCPWPALRLAKAMRNHACVEIVVDDPAAPSELRQLADDRGWTIEDLGSEPPRYSVMRTAAG